MMDEALLGEQQKNTHYNMTDNKHIEKFLTFSVQHRISQSHLHIVLAMLPDFILFFLSLVQTQIVAAGLNYSQCSQCFQTNPPVANTKYIPISI